MIQDLYKQKRSLELKWEQEHLSNGRYTLEMVRIDDKIKKAQELKDQGMDAHNNGDHAKSEKLLNEALALFKS